MSEQIDLTKSSAFAKLKYYSQQNGLAHAVASGVGRKSPGFWSFVGPMLTPGAFQRYAKAKGDGETMLNLGSGSNRIPGAFNVDIDPRADAFLDITKSVPLPDKAFDWIYCEEVIEHVNHKLGAALLKECLRILKPGGTIRLTTPDLEYFCNYTLASDPHGEEINQVFYEHGHRFIYSKESITAQLTDCGFTDIRFSSYKDENTRLGPLDSHADRFNHPPEIALYVEASRPA